MDKRIGIFLDRDGTLNEDNGYTYKTEDLRILPKVIEGLKKLKGLNLFIITNQSGINRGYYNEEDMNKFHERMLAEFEPEGIIIKKIYFCPHRPEENCGCRKPKTLLLKKAEEEFNLDLSDSYVIGDAECDILLAKNAGCKSVLVFNGKNSEKIGINPDYIAKNLEEAAEFILREVKGN